MPSWRRVIGSDGGVGLDVDGLDVDEVPPAAGSELHLALGQREQRVVAAPADVDPRMEVRAPLAHDDGPGPDHLAVEDLDSEALRVGVPAVAGGSAAFGLGHRYSSDATV